MTKANLMSKEAGQNKPAAKRSLTAMKAEVIQAAVERKKAQNAAKEAEASKPVQSTKTSDNVADAKLQNDVFAVYDSVDIDQLTDAAITAYKEGERNSRREGQMQIANILARYAQDKFEGDANPSKLYKRVGEDMKLQVATVQLIARHIYMVPEKTMDGKKNPLPRELEMRVRRIAPIVFYAIQERVPLMWSDDDDALMLPAWLAVTDSTMVKVFDESKDARMTASKPVALDGREGRTLANLMRRVGDPAQKKRNSNSGAVNGGDKTQQALQNAVGNAGLARTLTYLADQFAIKADKPFSDEIVELLAVCCEHVKARNGSDAMGKAFRSLAGKPEKATTKQAAA